MLQTIKIGGDYRRIEYRAVETCSMMARLRQMLRDLAEEWLVRKI